MVSFTLQNLPEKHEVYKYRPMLQKDTSQNPYVKIPVLIEQVLGQSVFPPNTPNRTVYLLSLAHYLLDAAN